MHVHYPPAWREGLLPLPNKDNPRKEENAMSKMSDMAQTIEELRSAAAAITEAANLGSTCESLAAPYFFRRSRTAAVWPARDLSAKTARTCSKVSAQRQQHRG